MSGNSLKFQPVAIFLKLLKCFKKRKKKKHQGLHTMENNDYLCLIMAHDDDNLQTK